MKVLYTSRSAYEAYLHCPRSRWLGYFYGGKGIVSTVPNVPFVTGTSVHKGPEYFLREYMQGRIDSEASPAQVDEACGRACEDYEKLSDPSSIDTRKPNDLFAISANNKYKQQLYLVEALVRTWAKVELPLLARYFDVLTVEEEIVVPLSSTIFLQSKPDSILKWKNNDNGLAYSLKTMRRFDEKKTYASHKISTQAITEAYAAQVLLKQIGEQYKGFLDYAQLSIKGDGRYSNLSSFLRKYCPNPSTYQIVGTKFCFLVKGNCEEKDGQWISDSPLITGWTDGETVAHSYKFPTNKTKSGFSNLGKAYERFDPWTRYKMSDWIEALPQMQDGMQDILKQQVITPAEKWISPEETKSTLQQIVSQEEMILEASQEINAYATHGSQDVNLDANFNQDRSACNFPTRCQFYEICHLEDWKGDGVDPSIRTKPLEHGYQWRIPHHKPEENYLKNEFPK